jgi:hypoxanthine phosphoribosyltransferase
MNHYYAPEAYGELSEGISEILISAEDIERRVMEMGQAISRDYEGCNPLLVGVLNGVVPFMAALMPAITIPIEVDFMAISKYGPDRDKNGGVRLEKDLSQSITDRHVLFVEDVIDTGLTLSYLIRNLRARRPASLKICTLFNKCRRRLIDLPSAYVGFDLPDLFIVGYGLDYRERYRNLPFVGLLKPEVFRPMDAEPTGATRSGSPSRPSTDP